MDCRGALRVVYGPVVCGPAVNGLRRLGDLAGCYALSYRGYSAPVAGVSLVSLICAPDSLQCRRWPVSKG